MLELIQITNDPAFARRCDALAGIRLFVDLERTGKAERQAGRNTFISAHQLEDVGRIKAVLRSAKLMVRVNPLHEGSRGEVDAVLAQGADRIMLPMFRSAAELRTFCDIVDARVPVTPLLETAEALASIGDWVGTAGVDEIYVGLNDLHISLRKKFMFEPLADGSVERVGRAALAHGKRFGFGGIARMDEGLLSGRDVLAEHLRLGSSAVILSRTFHNTESAGSFELAVSELREAERDLAGRTPDQVAAQSKTSFAKIHAIAAR